MVTHRLKVSLSLRSSLADAIKSMLDCLYSGFLGLAGVFVVGCNTISPENPVEYSSSSAMDLARFSSAASLARMRASSRSLARVARMEWGHSLGPLACDTPRAILSSRFDGGTGPLNGVSRWDGRASSV